MGNLNVRSGAWMQLEALFRESKQYRGDNSIRFVDLNKLMDAIRDKGTLEDPMADIYPDGGAFSCEYTFDPEIWGKWFTSQDTALTMAASDKDTVNQYAGRSQGHTVHKVNWGGRVVNSPGKAKSDFERMPSAMDRYAVLMQGEVVNRAKVNKRTGQTTEAKVGTLLRVAYSPSIGSMEERKARLVAFMSGQEAPELSRRPQPHVPEPPRKDAQAAADRMAPPVPRVGQNLKTATRKGDEDDEAMDALFPRKK